MWVAPQNATGEALLDFPRVITFFSVGYRASNPGVVPMAIRCGCKASGT
ncbi:hypothetical protein Q5A_000065 [Serratia inhibens PRI-2C]|nr:hypothetical protein Q5A_000065 [Serratia inhibens PRI-2C]